MLEAISLRLNPVQYFTEKINNTFSNYAGAGISWTRWEKAWTAPGQIVGKNSEASSKTEMHGRACSAAYLWRFVWVKAEQRERTGQISALVSCCTYSCRKADWKTLGQHVFFRCRLCPQSASSLITGNSFYTLQQETVAQRLRERVTQMYSKDARQGDATQGGGQV